MKKIFLLTFLCFCVTLSQAQENSYKDYQVFSSVPPSTSNVLFQNTIKETNTVNYFKYEYLYNGGGVAIGDVNNDGLPDIYFTGNMTYNRLYLNKGDLKFEDITGKAKASYANDWCTGVTMVDINNDGWLDIYVSASGYYEDANVRKNILFVNNGDANENGGIPTFTDRAEEYGIADAGYSIQSIFFDYDNDGDLDLYVANHPNLFREAASVFKEKMVSPPYENSDRLYRNDTENGKITFTDVSVSSGIANYSHSLGVVVSDFDNDGFIDIYVSNDYQQSDFLYKNTGKGVFVNIMDDAIKHFAKFSMGVDASDFNNDGLTDIFAVEMMAEDNKRQKTNMAPMDPKEFAYIVQYGFGYQYMHNALQLNNGKINQDANSEITFSEISYLSGVATTDWSWCPLFADFDNDGWKDLFVTNGYRRDVLDKDYQKEQKKILKSGKITYEELKDKIPASKIPNYIYKNNQDLTFTKKSADWGINTPINSNGAAYADLDLDGDLDLVVNNIDTVASIFKNNTAENNPNNFNYLKIKLQSSTANRLGLGAKVIVKTADGNTQTQELTLTRGYQSSVEPILHFGLGQHKTVDWVKVIWKNQKETILENIASNQVITIDDKNTVAKETTNNSTNTLFKLANDKYQINHKHQELEVDDYSLQVLLPHKLSQNGPGIAVGDVNGDKLDDFFIGGSAGFEGVLHIQQANDTFTIQKVEALTNHRQFEDMGAIFFDADKDGDNDLLVVSGSYQFSEQSGLFEHRLYFNDGKGDFKYDEFALPTMPASGSSVSAGDYDGDGDLDIFIGGRVVHGKYPIAPHSYLLENQNGKFKDVIQDKAPKLSNVGMITSAIWSDYDGDNDLDLITVGEWMPITIFINDNGKAFTPYAIPNSEGWWNSITGGDIDNDGDIDYILGNLGTNSKNKASVELPFHVYGNDFDKNGNYDIVLGYYNDGVQYPVRGLQCSSEQIPEIKEKIPTYDLFGSSTLEEIYGDDKLDNSLHLEVKTFKSAVLINNGAEDLKLMALPNEAQFAPINGTVVEDFDQDGCLDILAVGNQYPVEVETGRYDAMKGLFLKGNCDGTFTAQPYRESGFFVDGDAKGLSMIAIGNKPAIIATLNNDKTLVFDIDTKSSLQVKKSAEYSQEIILPKGKSRKYEFYIGSGYLSQQSSIYFSTSEDR